MTVYINHAEYPMKQTHIPNRRLLLCLSALILFAWVAGTASAQSSMPFKDGEPLPAGVEPYNDEAFYYTVQKGDTLWDISERFLKTAWKWPELWQRNAREVPILNPHLIYPGQRLLIYPDRGVIAAEPLPSGPAPQPRADMGEPIPAPAPSGGFEEGPLESRDTLLTFSPINRIGFIRRQPVKGHGAIFKVRGDAKQMIHERDTVYIRPTGDAPLVMGREYTIYKTVGPIRDPKTDRRGGYQHILTGRLEITRLEPEFAMGVIRSSFRTIRTGERLMPYNELSPKIPVADSVEGLEATIVSSEEGGRLLGEGSVVFIDRGGENGIAPGQRYNIVYQEVAKPNPDRGNRVILPPVVLGDVVVLRAEPSTATVVLTRSNRDIYPGAQIRTPIQ